MNSQKTNPGVVIVSSSNTKPKSLIKLITHSDAVENTEEPRIVSKEWEIDTKYYTANVDFIGITEDYVRTDEFNNSVEALIILMDSNKESGLEDLEKWTNIVNECNLEIKLLVSNYFTNTKISKAKATEWCLKRGFELIELYPSINTSDSDGSEIIEEKTGVARVIEALQTHVWPNLIMKPIASCYDEENISQPKTLSSNFDETVIDSLINDGVDDFTQALSRLQMFKESLSAMSSSQRKQNAEDIVTQFWQAIGGDEDELIDI